MFISRVFDVRDEFNTMVAERAMRLFGQHQPVVPIADFILQLLEGLANGSGVLIAFCRFGHVAGLLGPFAEIVQIVGIELLHLVGETGKGIERCCCRAGCSGLSDWLRLYGFGERSEVTLKFVSPLLRSSDEGLRMLMSNVPEPCVQVFSLLL